MLWQRQTVWVREVDGQLIVLDVDRQEIARHDIHSGKGATLSNRHHYRDLATTVRQLEEEIGTMLRPLDATALISLIRRTSPTIYKDQLAGIRQILRNHNQRIDPEVLNWICDRPQLTATRLRELLIVVPEMILRRASTEPGVHTGELNRYASITGGCHAHL